jgi:hypothetical protein
MGEDPQRHRPLVKLQRVVLLPVDQAKLNKEAAQKQLVLILSALWIHWTLIQVVKEIRNEE